MSKKSVTNFRCSNCLQTTSAWQGKCPNCGQWNTLEEHIAPKLGSKVGRSGPGIAQRLGDITVEQAHHFTTGLPECDLVLGGGLVPGGVFLLGGDPGIGKSTLALQIAGKQASSGLRTLYVTGEESLQQLKLRASRLLCGEDLAVVAETDLEATLLAAESYAPSLVVVDSIQTMRSSELAGVIGGVAQTTYATNKWIEFAKATNCAVVVIGHVTKEGVLAGPKTLEHMVDVVLYLEGERFGHLRLLRCVKNRFGSTGEIGAFTMSETGLVEAGNPSQAVLSERHVAPGSSIAAAVEGRSVILLEVQALVSESSGSYARRMTSGFDAGRLQLLLAIMQKQLGLKLSAQDVYVNVTGGIRVEERGMDLPVVMAVWSACLGVPWPEDVAAFGEVGLTGEVRSAAGAERRVKEAQKLGLKRVLVGGSAKAKNTIGVRHLSSLGSWLKPASHK